MFDKTINVKTIDLSGVNLPSSDDATCNLIYSALSTTYGFPLYLENFKVNGVKHDSVLVNSIIEEDKTIVNLNDCHLIVTPTDISVGKGVYGTSLESIVDKDGNPRFIEGDITMNTITGVTQTYGKWSLSGTHLMIVLCISVVSGTTIHLNDNLATVEVPDYVIDKINPLASNLVMVSRFEGRENVALSSDNLDALLKKDSVNQILEIKKANSDKSYSKNLNFRIQFDLLIDSDYED